MRAIAVENFGDEPRLMELPDPEPGPCEVLVAIDAASINPMDWKAAQGALGATMETESPLVLGFNGAGRLAAAVPTAGMTAEGALAKTGCKPGQALLILGATGGVGVLATQLATRAGITVIATARGEASAWIQGFGASETIDYTERPVAAALADAYPDGIDAVLDLVGNAEQVTGASRHVRDAGTVISTAFGVTDELSSQNRITAVNYQLDNKPARLEHATEALAAGQLVIPIQDEVTLAGGAAAIARHGPLRRIAPERLYRPEEEPDVNSPSGKQQSYLQTLP